MLVIDQKIIISIFKKVISLISDLFSDSAVLAFVLTIAVVKEVILE
jgi:hypothetical protein